MSPTWASPISSSCRSPSIPSIRPGATRPTGLYAPTARFGDPDGFARFVDGAHKAGLGVILDWVPAHFPTDAHGLCQVRRHGALRACRSARRASTRTGTRRSTISAAREVTSFLVNNALYWAREIPCRRAARRCGRLDALSRLFAQGRASGSPTSMAGARTSRRSQFLQDDEHGGLRPHPGIMTIAEESTAWPGVSQPVHAGGLGFGFKWNMGFMHDTLQYHGARADPPQVPPRRDDLRPALRLLARISSCRSAMTRWCTARARCSTKMAGDDWQKFANLRAYYGFMWGYPGKKLLFMGQEFAQRGEWSEEQSARLASARPRAARGHAAPGARSQPRSTATRRRCMRATASRRASSG